MSTPSSPPPIRVFISYAHADKDLRDRLDVHLANLKNQGVIDTWYDGDLVPGQEWEPILLGELETADIILLLISPDFMASRYIHTKELSRAMQRHAAGAAVVIPVLLHDVDYQDAPFAKLEAAPLNTKKQLQPIDTWRNRNTAFARVADGIRRVVNHRWSTPPPRPPESLPGVVGTGGERLSTSTVKQKDMVPAPALLPPGSRVLLAPNPRFVGRDDELRKLAHLLRPGDTTAIGQIAMATGLGGIGKTQLAAEFVHRYGQFFVGGVFWLSFADPAAVPTEVAACGGVSGMRLHADFGTLPLDDQVQLVQAAWETPLPRLLVFDNCEEEDLLDQWRPPHGGCRVLVTSRRAKWDGVLDEYYLPLGVLPHPQSITLLRKFRPDLSADDADLDAIAEELGDLPLALHLAGSFLKRYQQDMTATEYLGELRAITAIAHESLEGAGISPTKHDLSVVRTFRLTYDRLDAHDQTNALALNILAYITCFVPGEPIPRDWLKSTLLLQVGDKQPQRMFSNALRSLADLGLLQETEDGTVRVHRLLQAFLSTVRDNAGVRKIVAQAVLSVAERDGVERVTKSIPAYIPHLEILADTMLQAGHNEMMAAKLYYTLAYCLSAEGDKARAEENYKKSLALFDQDREPEPEIVAMIAINLCSLAAILQDGPDKVILEAQPLLERALEVSQKVFHASDPRLAIVLNGLGRLQFQLHNTPFAKRYLEHARSILEQAPNRWTPHMATVLTNLAQVSQTEGNYEEALQLCERALTIDQKFYSDPHPRVALRFSWLGSLKYKHGDYPGAQADFERALKLKERIFGEHHQRIKADIINLANALKGQQLYDEADKLYQRVWNMEDEGNT